jgi:hypothetical protein
MAGADPDPRRERVHGRGVERALVDELQRASHDRGRAERAAVETEDRVHPVTIRREAGID